MRDAQVRLVARVVLGDHGDKLTPGDLPHHELLLRSHVGGRYGAGLPRVGRGVLVRRGAASESEDDEDRC